MPCWYQAGAAPGFWWIFPVFFGSLWLLLIGFVVWFAARWFRPGGGYAGGPDPVSTLRERFARGEIDSDEYQQRLRALGGR